MIEIKFLRENPEVVKENIRKKYQDEKLPLVDEVIALDTESRKAKQEADDLRASRNRISKEIGALMGQGKKEEAEAKKAEVAAGAKRLAELEASETERQQRLQAGNFLRQILIIFSGGKIRCAHLFSSLFNGAKARRRKSRRRSIPQAEAKNAAVVFCTFPSGVYLRKHGSGVK